MKKFELNFKKVDMNMGDISHHEFAVVNDTLVIKDVESGLTYAFRDIEDYIELMLDEDYYVSISQFMPHFKYLN